MTLIKELCEILLCLCVLNCNGIKGEKGDKGDIPLVTVEYTENVDGVEFRFLIDSLTCSDWLFIGHGQDGESFPKQGEAWLVDGMDTTKADYHFEGGIFIIVKKFGNEKFAVIISWLPNAEPDLAGYKIYCNLDMIDVGNVTSHEMILSTGVYIFKMTAYDQDGNESGYSNKVKIMN